MCSCTSYCTSVLPAHRLTAGDVLGLFALWHSVANSIILLLSSKESELLNVIFLSFSSKMMFASAEYISSKLLEPSVLQIAPWCIWNEAAKFLFVHMPAFLSLETPQSFLSFSTFFFFEFHLTHLVCICHIVFSPPQFTSEYPLVLNASIYPNLPLSFLLWQELYFNQLCHVILWKPMATHSGNFSN